METINERIKEIIQVLYHGNASEFSRKANIKQPTLNTIIGGRQSKPSYEVINTIALNVKDVDLEWLLTGKGEMLKSNYMVQSQIANTIGGHNVNISSMPETGSQKIINEEGILVTRESWPSERTQLLSKISELTAEAERLKLENILLKNSLNDKDSLIRSKDEFIQYIKQSVNSKSK